MINRNNLWFFTLFSLILVLGVYYVTLPNDVFNKVKVKDNITNKTTLKQESPLKALRVSLTSTRKDTTKKLEEQLTDTNVSNQEKNNIYEQLKYLNEIQGREENIEKNLKNDLGLDCFTKIDNSDVSVVCISKEQNKKLANNIMRNIQSKNNTKLNISVKFQNK